MTIREHFRARFNRFIKWLLAAGTVLGGVLFWRYPHLSGLQLAIYCLLLAIPFGPMGPWLFRRRFLCPRCGTDLQKLRVEQVRQARRERGWFNVDIRPLWEAWDACPLCGCSFDDPYP